MRARVAFLAVVGVLLAGLLIWLLRERASAGDRAAAAPGGDAPAAGAAERGPAPKLQVATSERVDDALQTEIAAFTGRYLEAMAEGDREAIRRHWDGSAMLTDALAEVRADPDADDGIEHHPLPVTDETIRNHQDSMLDTILEVPQDERGDWAQKARVRDLVPLADGRYFVRLWADGVIRQPPAGRETGLALQQFGPEDRVEMVKDQRMVVARRGDGWRIVGFPRIDRQPPVAD